MLQLDGAALDMDGREFSYDIPAPFGPKRGPAFLKIVAKPAASVNMKFRAALDRIMHTAKVKDLVSDKAYQQTGDTDAFVATREADAKWVTTSIAGLNFDNCVISWETNIQNAQKDLEPNRDNFISLSQFEHPAINSLFEAIQRDLANFEKFSLEAEEAAVKEEVGN